MCTQCQTRLLFATFGPKTTSSIHVTNEKHVIFMSQLFQYITTCMDFIWTHTWPCPWLCGEFRLAPWSIDVTFIIRINQWGGLEKCISLNRCSIFTLTSSLSSFVLGSCFDEMVPGCFIPHELLGLVYIEICVFGDGVWYSHIHVHVGKQKNSPFHVVNKVFETLLSLTALEIKI